MHLKNKLKISTVFHPKIDGQIESVNGILTIYLRNYIAANQRDWNEWLALVEFYYNNHKQLATKHSLFFVARGSKPLLHVDLAVELHQKEETLLLIKNG